MSITRSAEATPQGYTRPALGRSSADVLVVCDTPSPKTHQDGRPLSPRHMEVFARACSRAGLEGRDFRFVGLAPPIAREDMNSAARKWAHCEPHVEELLHLGARHRLVITFGELASRAMLGRAVKITKTRGLIQRKEGLPPILPMLAPGFVERVPDHLPTFEADVHMVARLRDVDYDPDQVMAGVETSYEWCTDLRPLIARLNGIPESEPPLVAAVDTEGLRLRWWDPQGRGLTVQICTEPGTSLVVPLCERYYPELAEERGGPGAEAVRDEVEQVLTHPRIRLVGHNTKYDAQILEHRHGIDTWDRWLHDTYLMAWCVDENMMSKDLATCTRIWVPELAGYSDEFDQEVDKERMDLVPHDKMLAYAGGDPDATLRLARRLKPMMDRDPGQRHCYRAIQMPTLKTFGRVVERYGVKVDRDRLRDFATRVNRYLDAEHRELVRLAPPAAKRKHFRLGKGLSLTRPDFVRDILFTPGISFGLEPCAWTDSTRDLPADRRVPSTSAKDHLPYHVTNQDPLPSRVESHPLELGGEDDKPAIETVGDYCDRLRQWMQANKMRTTYIGDEEEGSGFWQYLDPEGCVHPSYGFRTNTGRTSSNDPNGQNFPSRGSLAKAYMRVFVPRPGFKFVKCDFSQIELRLIAWESMDPTMLEVYANDGDIHIMTAAGVLRVSVEEFLALPEAERKRWRTNAKPVNFGYAYGQGAEGFQVYAKTNYAVDFTLEECHEHRDAYFTTYGTLLDWHERRKEEARRYGGVRALHGGYRHLPSIYSDDRRIVSQAERQAVNAPIQRVASDFACLAMTRFTDRTDPERVRILGHIHDALWMEARDEGDHVEDCAASLKYVMETLPLGDLFGIESPVPIKADCEIGEDGGSFEERPDIPSEWALAA